MYTDKELIKVIDNELSYSIHNDTESMSAESALLTLADRRGLSKDMWAYVSRRLMLSKETIRTYEDYISWNDAVVGQHLSEVMIERHIHEMDMSKVLHYQDVSIEFIDKHFKLIRDVELLIEIKTLPLTLSISISMD